MIAFLRWRVGSGGVGRAQHSSMSGLDDLGSGDYAEIQFRPPVDGAAIRDGIRVAALQSGEVRRLLGSFPWSHVSRTDGGQNGGTWELLAFPTLSGGQLELSGGFGLVHTLSFPAGAHRLRACWGHI